MIFTLNDFRGLTTRLLPHQKDLKTMNRLRCLLFATIVVISSSMLALGGDIQGPGKSAPTPTPNALTTTSTTDGLTQPTTTEEIQIVWPDATTLLVELLLTIF